jgi:hypothetical protein
VNDLPCVVQAGSGLSQGHCIDTDHSHTFFPTHFLRFSNASKFHLNLCCSLVHCIAIINIDSLVSNKVVTLAILQS